MPKKLALAGASLILTLALLELAARAVVRRRELRPHTTRGSIIRFDPTAIATRHQ